MTDKKPAHAFDHAGRAVANQTHLETRLTALEAENERLRRVILLQERRWRAENPPPAEPIVFH